MTWTGRDGPVPFVEQHRGGAVEHQVGSEAGCVSGRLVDVGSVGSSRVLDRGLCLPAGLRSFDEDSTDGAQLFGELTIDDAFAVRAGHPHASWVARLWPRRPRADVAKTIAVILQIQ
jgi:hypothetical protein